MNEMNDQNQEDLSLKGMIKRDIRTFKRLSWKSRIRFLYDYYKWKILGTVTILICILTFASALWEGQKPKRMHICVALNNDEICSEWFDEFYRELSADGDTTPLDVNEDQTFDAQNTYYYIQELEVLTTVSSGRMDAAICGPDMYEYLLALRACMPLDTLAPAETFEQWKERGIVDKNISGIQISSGGKRSTAETTEGYYALDISNTEFGKKYNKKEQSLLDQEAAAPLYFVVISNTLRHDDCLSLAEAITR